MSILYRAALKEPCQVVRNWLKELPFVYLPGESNIYTPYPHNLGGFFLCNPVELNTELDQKDVKAQMGEGMAAVLVER